MQNFLLMFSRWFQIMQIRQRHHVLSDYSQRKSVIFLFSSMNQAKTHKYEFEHFIYEQESLREFYRGHFCQSPAPPTSIDCKPSSPKLILWDPGADKGARESLNGWKNIYETKKSIERREEPLGAMSYQTSSKRSPPFWLLIGARKLVFFCVF